MSDMQKPTVGQVIEDLNRFSLSFNELCMGHRVYTIARVLHDLLHEEQKSEFAKLLQICFRQICSGEIDELNIEGEAVPVDFGESPEGVN